MRPKQVSAGLSQLVSAELFQRPEDDAVLSMADELIRNGGGKALYKALLLQLGARLPADEVVLKFLTLLETSIEAHPGVSAYLMARLYARARRLREQAVIEAIELWMSGLASGPAAAALVRLTGEPIRPALRRRCLQWADGIRQRADLID
jgi:hypothetical protein